MCIRGEEELIQEFQTDRTLKVSKWKKMEGQGAAGGEFFCSSLPSPSTTSQVGLSTQLTATVAKGFAPEVYRALLVFDRQELGQNPTVHM